MTPLQEVCNAVSMFAATMVFAYEAFVHWPNPWLIGLLGGDVMHLPASVAYHMHTALTRNDNHLNGELCRLDQSMIHVSGSVFAFVLSQGSVPYTLAHACFSIYAIRNIWPEHSTRRWVLGGISVCLWLLPMAASGHWMECVSAGVAFYGGGICFVSEVNEGYLRGWGHVIFHLGAACTAKYMCAACHAPA